MPTLALLSRRSAALSAVFALMLTVLVALPASADLRFAYTDPSGDVAVSGTVPDFDAVRSSYDVQQVLAGVDGSTLSVTARLAAPWTGEGAAGILLSDGLDATAAFAGVRAPRAVGEPSTSTDCLDVVSDGAELTFLVDIDECNVRFATTYVSISVSKTVTSASGPSYAVDYAPEGRVAGPFDTRVDTTAPLPAPTPRSVSDTCDAHQTATFDDIVGSPHAYSIRCVAGYDITSGRSPGVFDPAAGLSEGQTATFLVRMLAAAGRPLPEGVDICGGTAGVHEGSLERLITAGIVSASHCTASGPMTRGTMALWVHETLRHSEVYFRGVPLPDWYIDDDAHPAHDAIDTVTSHGIVSGKTAGIFAPDDTLTRAQMATFITRTLDLLLTS